MFTIEGLPFRNLTVYQQAKALVKETYALLKQFPAEERYAMCDQLRRASVSVPSNLAEGNGRFSPKEQLHFVEIAFGSVNEVVCQFDIAHDLGYISEEQFLHLATEAAALQKLLSGYRSAIMRRMQ